MAVAEPAGAPPASGAEALGWKRFRVDEASGDGVGRVEGLFADAESGTPAWLVARLGRFGRIVAVPFRDCAAGVGAVWVPYTREELRSAPSLDPSRTLTAEQELAICAHYGIDGGVGRAAELEGRSGDTVTARPAG
jgi:hypothetical protein